MAAEVDKELLKEVIPSFELPKSLQNNNGPAFMSQVMKGIMNVLGIKWNLYSAQRAQSSGNIEPFSQIFKWTSVKLC